MKVLIACEYSGVVREAFADKGHYAMSCDLLPTDHPGSIDRPANHYQGDVFDILYDDWDLVIAHPPCTYLTISGNKWMKPEFESRFPTRKQDREKAINFFMAFTKLKCRFAIENPVGIMSTRYRKPNQIIQPWQFGHAESKQTCLWLNDLPLLNPTDVVKPIFITHKNGKRDSPWHYKTICLSKEQRQKERSKTYEGIATAMAAQWG